MIARIWQGQTRLKDRDAYLDVLRQTGIRDYRATPGNRGAWVLVRERGDEAEFTLLTLWDSHEAIRAFAGEDIERARYYPIDSDYLLRFAEKVEHFDCPLANAEALDWLARP
jgi:hypothetical protein